MLSSILIFLIVLSILILVHELGHFIVARRAGIWVEEFGFGLPPRAFGKKIGETIYSVNWLPFGGFVRLHGEQEEEGITKPRKAFLNKSKKTRVGIIIAGVIMNFLLAIVAFAIVYSFSGVPRETGKVLVVDVGDGTPASKAQIVVGDRILSVDGKEVESSDDVTALVTPKGGKHNLILETGPDTSRIQKKVSVETTEDPQTKKWYMGIILSSQEIYYPPVWQRPFYGVYFGFKEAVYWGQTIAVGLGTIIVEAFKGHAPKDISGPVGIFAVTSEAAKIGLLALINFIGVLSVNLAILNIFPFPALDGGRLLFIGIESVIGRKIIPKVEATIHTIGMVILLALLLAVTIGDIRRLIVAGGIDGFLQSVIK